MLFDTWSDLGRTVVASAVAYVLLVAMLRLSGKRTLAKLNAFDLVVTVALGSTLATIILSADVSLAEGALALFMLVCLQLAAAWTSTRSVTVRRLTKAEPTLLLRDGRLLRAVMARHRVTESEIRQAIRASGQGEMASVAAVVLETNGSFSVIPRSQHGSGDALDDVA